MALVINEAGATPVTIDTITIERNGKSSCVPFRVGSLHEMIFYRVRNLDGNIVRYAYPDAYFATLVRNCLQQVSDSNTDSWADSMEDIESVSDAYAFKLARSKSVETPSLIKILENRDHANKIWNARRKNLGFVRDVTMQSLDDEDSEASEDEYPA